MLKDARDYYAESISEITDGQDIKNLEAEYEKLHLRKLYNDNRFGTKTIPEFSTRR